MPCGTPVIGSAVGGIKSTIRDGRTGFLVPPRDPAAVAERLAAIFTRPELGRRLGAAGRERVLRHFTWSQVADRMEAVYARMLGDEGRSAVAR